jgi:hypothetical protein
LIEGGDLRRHLAAGARKVAASLPTWPQSAEKFAALLARLG